MRYDKIRRKEEKLKERARNAEAERDQLAVDLDKVRDVLEEMMHEVRRFGEDLSSATQRLRKQLEDDDASKSIIEKCDTIFYTSGMISVRLNLADLELNPALLSQKQKVRAGIYKKFEKARYVLSSAARDRKINLRFSGKSFSEIEAITAFDFVPFVILDNAIKYSPERQMVEVKFVDDSLGKEGYVEVSSVGPTIGPEDVDNLFHRGYRGNNALESGVPGEGLGLALAKELCDMHGIRLEVLPMSHDGFELNGIRYGTFRIRLHWQK